MEAARHLPALFPPRRADGAARELEQLRPLGEAFLLRRFGGSINRADAEDAVAEVVIRLHRKIEAGRPPRNLRAAFFTSVRNAAVDQLRSRAARPTAPLEFVADAPAEEVTPSERAVSREDAVRLQEALGRMRANYREAIILRFGLGLTVPEIAERLSISLPAAKKLVLRSTEQARKRLAAIEGQEFCSDAQDLARRSLAEKELSGVASPEEQRLLRSHLQHCGHCKSFLAELRHSLHELGGSALFAGAAGHQLGIGGLALGWFEHAATGVRVAAAKLRLAAFKATGALQPTDATTAGALTSTAQKAIAICGAATATTATCLATGVIGPGLGAGAVSPSTAEGHSSPPAIVKAVSEASAAESPTLPEPTPESTPADESPSPSVSEPSAPPPEPTPSQQASEEFGFESTAPPAERAPASEPAPTPPSSSAPSSSGGGGGGGGGEQFGFGG